MPQTSMASVPTTTAASTTTTDPSGLRSLHLIRAVFSLVWVALVFGTSASLVSADKPTAIAGALVVVYPLWDVIATLLERRMADNGSANRVADTNVALGLAATIGMAGAVLSTIATVLLVFGIWALLSGALQFLVAMRRRRAVGAQWPMIISGAQSTVAGVTIAAMSASETSGLSTVAGYSAVGAFWFLASVIALAYRGRNGR